MAHLNGAGEAVLFPWLLDQYYSVCPPNIHLLNSLFLRRKHMATVAPSSSVSEPTPETSRLPRPALAIIMIALLLTAFLEALDNLIVTPALPRIASSLQGFDRYTWVVTA